METLFKDNYIYIKHDKTNQFLHTIWFTDADMQEETYLNVLRNYLRYVRLTNAKNVLIDACASTYTVPPVLQETINQEIYIPAFEAGVRKLAFLVSSDFYTQLSLEVLVDDTEALQEVNSLQQQFFEDEQVALDWLLQN